MLNSVVGARIKARREELGFNQEVVARHLGFKDRQILSNIETGERKVSADELLRVTEVLAAPLEYFTDPFLLVGEGQFSWRQSGVAAESLNKYEQDAGRVIALFRVLGAQLGKPQPLLRQTLKLSKASTFEETTAAGERFAETFGLGDKPAFRLAEVMAEELGILVLMVDAIKGVSGAACRLPELDVVLINRTEVAGRRHYDLAHELFHILTWDLMPPERVEESKAAPHGRVEQLADNFAAALLMPRVVLAPYGEWSDLAGKALVARLNEEAEVLGVTSSALRWRLVNTGLLPKAAGQSFDEAMLRTNARKPKGSDLPPLFSKPFAQLVVEAVEAGRISVRRVAALLDLSIEEIEEKFAALGVEFDAGV